MVVTWISFVSIVAILKSVMCTCPERREVNVGLDFGFISHKKQLWFRNLNENTLWKGVSRKIYSDGKAERKYFSLQDAFRRALLDQISPYLTFGGNKTKLQWLF